VDIIYTGLLTWVKIRKYFSSDFVVEIKQKNIFARYFHFKYVCDFFFCAFRGNCFQKFVLRRPQVEFLNFWKYCFCDFPRFFDLRFSTCGRRKSTYITTCDSTVALASQVGKSSRLGKKWKILPEFGRERLARGSLGLKAPSPRLPHAHGTNQTKEVCGVENPFGRIFLGGWRQGPGLVTNDNFSKPFLLKTGLGSLRIEFLYTDFESRVD